MCQTPSRPRGDLRFGGVGRTSGGSSSHQVRAGREVSVSLSWQRKAANALPTSFFASFPAATATSPTASHRPSFGDRLPLGLVFARGNHTSFWSSFLSVLVSGKLAPNSEPTLGTRFAHRTYLMGSAPGSSCIQTPVSLSLGVQASSSLSRPLRILPTRSGRQTRRDCTSVHCLFASSGFGQRGAIVNYREGGEDEVRVPAPGFPTSPSFLHSLPPSRGALG